MRALKYVQDYGIQSEYSYPYKRERGPCHFNKKKSIVSIKGIVNIKRNDEESLKDAVLNIGPIAVSILVTDNFKNYKSGVFYDTECIKNKQTNHAVLIVGFGIDPVTKQDYWLVKNSWGK